MLRRLASVAGILAGLAAGTAVCAQEPPALRGALPDAALAAPAPMVFKLGRFVGSPACGLQCAELIYASGEIRPDTVEALLILQSRLKRPLPVYLNSPGGNLEGGLALGRALRNEGMDAHVGALDALDCGRSRQCSEADRRGGVAVFERDPLPAICNSSCVYAFAGGVRRALGAGSSLGVHRFFLARADDPLRRPLARISRGDQLRLERSSRAIADYLTDMGVDPAVLALASAVDPQDVRALSAEETTRLGLVTPPFGPVPRLARAGDADRTGSLPVHFPSGADDGGWPVVRRDGQPVLLLSLTAKSRRFGAIVNELAIGCAGDGERYHVALREIAPNRPPASPRARIVAEAAADAVALRRSTALSADRLGILVVEVVSEATAGYPARLEFPGRGLREGIERLDFACRRE